MELFVLFVLHKQILIAEYPLPFLIDAGFFLNTNGLMYQGIQFGGNIAPPLFVLNAMLVFGYFNIFTFVPS